MAAPPERLPIDDALPEVLAALRAVGAVVVVAPPGAGKTTRVPPAVLDAGLAGDGRVVLLQPRRVAARSCAARMAAERGGVVGGEVGFRIRFEDRTGPATRIEVVTEGLLTRRLQADPFLEGVGCVVLDEFHERSLHADLALALLREVRAEVRPDLRLVVMSATLDPGPVAGFLGCPVVHSPGRSFPVEIRYDAGSATEPAVARCAAAVRGLLGEVAGGDVLAFLPGVGEISRVARALEGVGVPVLPLHGSLSAADQDAALAGTGGQKVVLATNVAETSVTLPRVRGVVDSGLARVPRFDPALGLARLEQGGISQASADQRAGRAGRTGPGVCRRLWTEARQRQLAAAELPEVRRADLARVVLELRAWGADPAGFRWFEAPEPAALAAADDLLRRLGALDDSGVTSLGRTLLALPVHPRLGRVVVAGHAAGCLSAAAGVGALAAERDVFVEAPDLVAGSDLGLRLEALAGARGLPVHPGRLARARQAQAQLVAAAVQALGRPRADRAVDDSALAGVLRAGFPDRVALRRAPGSDRFKLASGAGAVLDRRSAVRDAALVLAVGLEAGARGARAEHQIRSACALEVADLPLERVVETRFDADREAVAQLRVVRYGALELSAHPAQGAEVDQAAVEAALAAAVAARPGRAFALEGAAGAWVARLRWLAAAAPELGLPGFPELDQPGPVTPLVEAVCVGRRRFSEVRRADLLGLLQGLAGAEVCRSVERLAPERLALPDGTTKALEYLPGAPPVLAARIQQLFGLTQTPTVAGGRVAVMVHLLAPNQRPAQITQDLASFWRSGYPAVRRELRGRYPKHSWPEDPLTATPVSRPGRPRG